jgi:hypothetical protein
VDAFETGSDALIIAIHGIGMLKGTSYIIKYMPIYDAKYFDEFIINNIICKMYEYDITPHIFTNIKQMEIYDVDIAFLDIFIDRSRQKRYRNMAIFINETRADFANDYNIYTFDKFLDNIIARAELFNAHYDILLILLFQIFYTIYAFESIALYHNDMHLANILISTASELYNCIPVYNSYQIDDITTYIVPITIHTSHIIDFGLSIKNIPESKHIRSEFANIETSRSYFRSRDAIMFIHSFISYSDNIMQYPRIISLFNSFSRNPNICKYILEGKYDAIYNDDETKLIPTIEILQHIYKELISSCPPLFDEPHIINKYSINNIYK